MPQLDFDGAASRLSADNIRGQSGSTITIVSGHNLVGSGSGLTALNATNLASGTVPTARLGSGTANNTVFLRGDGSWAAAGVDGITSSADATAITITSAEKVGIGIASPDGRLHIHNGSAGSVAASGNGDDFVIENSTTCGMSFLSPNNTEQFVLFGDQDDNDVGYIVYNHYYNDMRFGASAATRMAIDTTGAVLMGKSGSLAPKQVGAVEVESQVGIDNGLVVWTSTNDAGAMNMVLFCANTSTTVGSITSTSSATAFNTSSDYRLKENLVPMGGAIDRLNQLKPYRFNFIVDPNKVVDGFVAHEAQEVVPEAVTGEKDAMKMEEYEITPEKKDSDGKVIKKAVKGKREVPDMQGIDQAKIVPLLVGALQEAIGRIEVLEQEVATLKGE